jgi:hypothetical protein
MIIFFGILFLWISNFKLGSQNPQDNSTWGTGRVLMASESSIAPNQQYTFNFNVTAPATVGTYNFQWKMVHEGVRWFGDLSQNISVSVVESQPPVSGDMTITPHNLTITGTVSMPVTTRLNIENLT